MSRKELIRMVEKERCAIDEAKGSLSILWRRILSDLQVDAGQL